MKNVSLLLQDLAAHGVELKPDGMFLPAPKWPEQCPEHLRQSYVQNRPEIMCRIAPPVFIHLKTRSRCTNTASTGQYARHPSTEIVSLLALIDDLLVMWLPPSESEFAERVVARIVSGGAAIRREAIVLGTGPSLPPVLRQAAKSGRAFCSHNSHNRDALIWTAKKLPQPLRWIDTRFLARAGGWSDILNELGRQVTGFGLSGIAPELIRAFCEPDKDGFFRSASLEEWTIFLQGSVDQLLLLADIYDQIAQHDEPEILEVDRAINDRGIGIDVALSGSLLRLQKENTEHISSCIGMATRGEVTPGELHQVSFLLLWLRAHGFDLPNLSRETIEWLLNHARAANVQYHPAVAAVLKARLAIAQHPAGQLDRALELIDQDDRLRNHLKYCWRYSGQWSGQGVQFDEFPTSTVDIGGLSSLATNSPDLETFRRSLPETVTPDGAITSLVPACFVAAPGHLFCIADYVEIEDRLLAWCIGAQSVVNPGQRMPQQSAIKCALKQAITVAINAGVESIVGKCRFNLQKTTLSLHLPSGRTIYYRNVTISSTDPAGRPSSGGVETQFPRDASDELFLDRLVDGIVQAIGRDLLAAALIQCELQQLPVVLHVHKKIVVEFPETSAPVALERLVMIMSTPPEWAAGLPVDVEGSISLRYVTAQPMGATVLKSENGKFD